MFDERSWDKERLLRLGRWHEGLVPGTALSPEDRRDIAAFFADPAFDMLLFVFLEEEEGRQVETSACYRASGVPRTTAVRWINMLLSMGMWSMDLSWRVKLLV